MSDVNVIPSNLVAIRKRQFEQLQDEWFSARWAQQNAEQSLEVAREHTRIATERKLQAERELEAAREEEYRQSRAGAQRTHEEVLRNIRQSLRQMRVAATPPQEGEVPDPVLSPNSSAHMVFTEPPASPDSTTVGEPVATSTPVVQAGSGSEYTQLLTPPPQHQFVKGLT